MRPGTGLLSDCECSVCRSRSASRLCCSRGSVMVTWVTGARNGGTGYKGEADASAYKLYTWKTELSTEKELIKSVAEDDMLS